MAKVTDPKLLAELKARFEADPLVIKWTPKRQSLAELQRQAERWALERWPGPTQYRLALMEN